MKIDGPVCGHALLGRLAQTPSAPASMTVVREALRSHPSPEP